MKTAIAIIIVLIVIFLISSGEKPSGHAQGPWISEPPERRAGRIGEQKAADIIHSVLRADDKWFTNVNVSFDGKRTELDNVVVNKYGVFIIEVKNYTGRLRGDEYDYEWTKYHITDAGNSYTKTVKNPVKQVKRQVYILAKYLENHKIRVWISGYAFLLQGNSPIKSEYILSNASDIDRAIHTCAKTELTPKSIEAIKRLLR